MKNLSKFRVRASAEIGFGGCRTYKIKSRFWGDTKEHYYSQYGHSLKFDLIPLSGEGTIAVDVSIKVHEEVIPYRADVDAVDRQVTKNNSEDINRKVTEINNSLRQMRLEAVRVECPVCMEDVRPPMRLKHCAQVSIIN